MLDTRIRLTPVVRPAMDTRARVCARGSELPATASLYPGYPGSSPSFGDRPRSSAQSRRVLTTPERWPGRIGWPNREVLSLRQSSCRTMGSGRTIRARKEGSTQQPPDDAHRSPDGRYWWDGTQWRPVPAQSPAPPQLPRPSIRLKLPPPRRRRWPWIAVGACALVGLMSLCEVVANGGSKPSATPTPAHSLAVQHTPTPTAPVAARQATTASQISTSPAPPQRNLCGAPPNPWGYNLCGGNVVYNPPPTFCRYFRCIANFWNSTLGYVDECNDATYSHSGGRRGACSSHGGEEQPLYG